MRRLVLGDVHGAHRALLQVLERASYNPKKDELILLGDLTDGWPESAQVVDYLSKLPRVTWVLGNHDQFCLDWLSKGYTPHIWTSQGGKATIKSYEGSTSKQRDKHLAFFLKTVPYHIDKDNNLFVHGGFNWHIPIEKQDVYSLTWDRNLFAVAHMWQNATNKKQADYTVKAYKEVFIGHTTTSRSDPELRPVHVSNVWCLDQGAGWEGKLTCLDVVTKEFWQSDIVSTLYPEERGR